MNKKCHWSLASHLMGDGSWRLRGLALKVGSIMPDILLYTYWTGHKYDTTAAAVEANLDELKRTGSWTLYNCFRLGYNLHFLEDYFTYPHNSHFEGGFIAHCWYEHRLSKAMGAYLRQKRSTSPVPSTCSAVSTVLNHQHSAYMNAIPSPEVDAAYIVSAAEAVAAEVFEAFSRQSVTPRARAFMVRTGLAQAEA